MPERSARATCQELTSLNPYSAYPSMGQRGVVFSTLRALNSRRLPTFNCVVGTEPERLIVCIGKYAGVWTDCLLLPSAPSTIPSSEAFKEDVARLWSLKLSRS